MHCNNYGTLFVTLLIVSHVSTGEYGDRIKNASETTTNLEMQESRYHGYAVPRPRTELPVNFQAPYASAKDYWTEQPRRTFYDYPADAFTRPITEGINSFYGLMNHFFGTEEPPPRRKPSQPQYPSKAPYETNYPQYPSKAPYETNYPQYPSKAPYDFEPQYHQQPYRQQYLPAHKPLRASVIKLEPLRATPQFVPLPYATTAKYYPQFVKILSDVLVENSYKNQLAALGFENDAVLEKPETTYAPNIVPTTYKPKKKPFAQKTTPFPGSIQDQLPPVKTGQDTRIPYVSEQSTTTGTAKIVFHETKPTVTPTDIQIDVRNALQSVTKSSTAPVTFEITTRHTPRITPPPASIRTSTPIVFERTTKSTPRRTPPPFAIRTSPPVVFESTTENTPKRIPFPLESQPSTPVIIESTTFKTIPVTFESTTDGQTAEQSIREPTVTTSEPPLIQTTGIPVASVLESASESEQSQVTNIREVETPITTPVPIITVTPQQGEETTPEPYSDQITTEQPTTTTDSEITTQPMLLLQSSEIRPVRTELMENVEPLEHSRFNGPFPKRLEPRRATTDPTVSADYVTDLTIKGLADERRRGSANLRSRQFSNVFNMSTVVGFEIARVNGTAPPPRSPNLFLNVELSLDAKILKDTNWDGYQPPIPTQPVTPQVVDNSEKEESVNTQESTTISTITISPTEDMAPTTTDAIFTSLGTTEIPATTLPTPATTENDTAVIATRITKTISRSLRARRPFGRNVDNDRRGRAMKPPNFDEKFNIGGFITESSSIEPEIRRDRKYQRRARVQAFTPYPSQKNETEGSETPLKLGTLTRPFQPRRTHPNVTLTFGNRRAARKNDVVKQEEEGGKSSVRRGTRKELYRGRTYPSQLRRRTTEQPTTDLKADSQ